MGGWVDGWWMGGLMVGWGDEWVGGGWVGRWVGERVDGGYVVPSSQSSRPDLGPSLLIPGRAVGRSDIIRPSKSWVKEARHCCPKPVPCEDTWELACLITLILGDHQARTAGGRALPGFRGLSQA